MSRLRPVRKPLAVCCGALSPSASRSPPAAAPPPPTRTPRRSPSTAPTASRASRATGSPTRSSRTSRRRPASRSTTSRAAPARPSSGWPANGPTPRRMCSSPSRRSSSRPRARASWTPTAPRAPTRSPPRTRPPPASGPRSSTTTSASSTTRRSSSGPPPPGRTCWTRPAPGLRSGRRFHRPQRHQGHRHPRRRTRQDHEERRHLPPGLERPRQEPGLLCGGLAGGYGGLSRPRPCPSPARVSRLGRPHRRPGRPKTGAITRVRGTGADLGWGRRPYVRRVGCPVWSTARAGGGRRPWSSRTAGVRQWQSASRSSHGSPTWTAS